MITSQDFDRLIYRKPKTKDKRPQLQNIFGIDSEAYTTGEPFMFCTSESDIFLPKDIPQVFFEPGSRYHKANFIIYNIKYDSGALLYHLPKSNLEELRIYGKTSHNDFRYHYIAHKRLRIEHSNLFVNFWDVSQFYVSTLDRAAQTYLDDRKTAIRTKRFTPKYVRRYFNHISRYCIHDALLTKNLGIYLINKLKEFGITASSLYSCASISFKYFSDRSRIVTSWRFYNAYPDVLKYACDAYEGGKFEVTQRGAFPLAYEYDLTSAYPCEIANLIDISRATVRFTSTYEPDATYGFLRVLIENPDGKHLPCGKQLRNLRVYPAGRFYLTITREEYDYLLLIGIRPTIISACWLFTSSTARPYKGIIKHLFDIKSQVKGKDRMLYNVSKIVMNSFYGKCVQCIPQPDGRIVAGAGWNPVYGAVITANTRIKVTRIQNMLEDDCLAVHTDSVMTTRPIPEHFITGEIGEFEYVTEGKGVIVSCGQYQIGDISKFRGFIPRKGETWEAVLSRFPHRKKIPYRQLHVESWIEAMAKGHEKNEINVFEPMRKDIDLNADVKRIWPSRVRGRDLLSRLEKSEPKILLEPLPPKEWGV